jgi:hypothetical protein
MKAKAILAYLKTQLEGGDSPFEKEVLLRVAGRDYAIRSIDASTSAILLEGGEEVTYADTLAGGRAEGPGGPEGEGVEPAPPGRLRGIKASEAAPQENQEG